MTKKELIQRLLNDPLPMTAIVLTEETPRQTAKVPITELVPVHHAEESEDGNWYRALGDAGETVLVLR